MRACHHVEITTPKGVALNGLLFGPKKPQTIIVWVHGLGSSAFSRLSVADALVNKDTAVLTFFNRGHDKVTYVKRGKQSIRAGAAHEIFTDCVDDIEGAIRSAKQTGAKQVFLAGHSTGCQKSVYWAAKRGKGVEGIILLAPVSDYAAEVMLSGSTKVMRGLTYAKQLLKKGRPHELMPEHMRPWPLLTDAQRYVSLFSGESAEEIFPYWNPTRRPTTLRRVELPILALLAERDEYQDRPAAQMAEWFKQNLPRPFQVRIIPNVEHGFRGGEFAVAKAIRAFIKDVIL